MNEDCNRAPVIQWRFAGVHFDSFVWIPYVWKLDFDPYEYEAMMKYYGHVAARYYSWLFIQVRFEAVSNAN